MNFYTFLPGIGLIDSRASLPRIKFHSDVVNRSVEVLIKDVSIKMRKSPLLVTYPDPIWLCLSVTRFAFWVGHPSVAEEEFHNNMGFALLNKQ